MTDEQTHEFITKFIQSLPNSTEWSNLAGRATRTGPLTTKASTTGARTLPDPPLPSSIAPNWLETRSESSRTLYPDTPKAAKVRRNRPRDPLLLPLLVLRDIY